MAKKCDNCYVPKYIPNDLPWYEYLQNKCNDFFEDTDNHFKEMKMLSFDLIKNNVSKEKEKEYQQIDYHEIIGYPHKLREEICSLIFRIIKRDDMYVKKETIDEHFKKKNVGVGRG